jgi:hypothetical protein
MRNTAQHSDDLGTPAPELPPVVAIIDSYAPLVQKGATFRGYCPFCNDMEERFVVRSEAQEWHCFGCGASGDVYDFVCRVLGVSCEQAHQVVAELGHTKPAVQSVAQGAPASQAVPDSGDGAYAEYFERLRRIRGYAGAVILRPDGGIVAIDETGAASTELVKVDQALSAAGRLANQLLGAAADADSEILLSATEGALVFLTLRCDGQPLRVALFADDPSQQFLARLSAGSLRRL